MKVQLSKYTKDRPFERDIDGNFPISKSPKEIFIDEYLYKLRHIIQSQVITEDNISTISLHIFTDTQMQTMIKIFSEQDKGSSLYQEALHILNN